MYTCALPGLLNHLNQHFVSFLLRHISVPVFVPETTNSPSETFALLQDARQLSPNPIGPRQFNPWLSEDKKGHHWVRNRYLMGEMMANWGEVDKIMVITQFTLGYPPFRELLWVPSEPWTEPWTSHPKTYLGHRGMEENFEEHHPFLSKDRIGVKTISIPKKRVRKHLGILGVGSRKGVQLGDPYRAIHRR